MAPGGDGGDKVKYGMVIGVWRGRVTGGGHRTGQAGTVVYVVCLRYGLDRELDPRSQGPTHQSPNINVPPKIIKQVEGTRYTYGFTVRLSAIIVFNTFSSPTYLRRRIDTNLGRRVPHAQPAVARRRLGLA